MVTSKLAEVELPRALRRDEPARLAAVPAVPVRLNRLDIDDPVRATPSISPPPTSWSCLGMLDTGFVTYDNRLAQNAGEVGLAVAAPGQPAGR